MRVCRKHREDAIESLVSTKTGEEFDLCLKCAEQLRDILHGPESEPEKPKRNRKSHIK